MMVNEGMKTDMSNDVWRCGRCDFVYDELLGQHEKGILPGTAWEALPQHWTCAVCGAGRAEFAPVALEDYLQMRFGVETQP